MEALQLPEPEGDRQVMDLAEDMKHIVVYV
jgi:hypothetical protein